MDLGSISIMRTARDELKKHVKKIKGKDYSDQRFGTENEYTIKGILSGIDSILLDISAALRKPAQLIQYSTYAERNNLVTALNNIISHISNGNIQSIATTLDQIKPVLRSWGTRFSNERKEELSDYLNELQKEILNIKEEISSLKDVRDTSKEYSDDIHTIYKKITEDLEEVKRQEEELSTLITKTEDTRTDLEQWLENDKEVSEEISELLSLAKGHTEIIENFSKKIAQREGQLENQQVITEEYSKKLKSFEEEQKSHLEKARQLIDDAKRALEYKTAEGLSAAFMAQYDTASDRRQTVGWLFGAGVFVAVAVGIGIWIALAEHSSIPMLIARFSLIPMLVAGAWFCASQYVKQKNIAEDYAYKSVLAKSIVGFSDQLSDSSGKGEEYSHYMKSVLAQIHNDPLRKHGTNSQPSNSEEKKGSDLEKELSEIKDALKQIKENYKKNIPD